MSARKREDVREALACLRFATYDDRLDRYACADVVEAALARRRPLRERASVALVDLASGFVNALAVFGERIVERKYR